MRKLTLTALALLAAGLSAHAQRLMGIATGNWSGTNSLYLNPASIADSRCRFAVDLFTVNAFEDNTLGKVNLNNAFGSSASGSGIFEYSNRQKFDMLFPALELRLPGVMVSIDNKNSVAFTMRGRGMNQFTNFDRSFYRIITDPPKSAASGEPYNVQSPNFNWTLHGWTEYRLTYAREVYNKDEHYVSAGITVSRLNGLGFIGVKGNLNSQFYPDNDSLRSTNTDIEVSTTFADSLSQLSNGVGDAVHQFFNSKTGHGWGMDLGVVYEYRPDEENSDDPGANKYKVRASVAITDLGSIKYEQARGAHIRGNGSISAGELGSNFGNYNSFAEYANAHDYYLTDTALTTKTLSMPTALVIGADYHAVSHLYVNATAFLNMADRQQYGSSYYSQVTITPRWDTKWFSAGLPISYNALSGAKVGLGIRAGGFIIGSDDLLIAFGSHYGANVYVGGFVPIYKKHKKSADKNTTRG